MKKIICVLGAISVIANIFLGIGLYTKFKKQKTLESEIEYKESIYEKKLKSGETIDISRLTDKEKENLMEQINLIENLSEEEKIEIGKKLFDDYMRYLSANIKENNDNREVNITCSNYRITKVSVIETTGNSFTIGIDYDVQGVGEKNVWIAAFGDIAEDNWVLNKYVNLKIIKYNDKYFISKVWY